MHTQAAQRGKAAAPTQAEAGDPLGTQYGDTQLIQSSTEAAEQYLSINSLSEEQNGQKVQSAPTPFQHILCLPQQIGRPSAGATLRHELDIRIPTAWRDLKV